MRFCRNRFYLVPLTGICEADMPSFCTSAHNITASGPLTDRGGGQKLSKINISLSVPLCPNAEMDKCQFLKFH